MDATVTPKEATLETYARLGMDRTARGRTGEQFAASFLAERGYVVLAQNQRTPLGELDLICRSLCEIVVVEVKSRSSEDYGEALEAIGPRKARRLRAAAVWWLADQGLFPCPVRFDAVVVLLDRHGGPCSVHHLRNILET
jgi:putative endonuclease